MRCPTAQGIGGPPPSPYGAAAWTLTLPRRFVGTLAFYTDTQGLMLLLGPRGWACHAGYGADGGGGVDVFPSGTPMFGTAPWVEPRLTEGVTGSQTSACFSCTVDQACPLFPAAALAEIQNYQTACKPHPPQERVTTVGYDAKGFEDPPGVKGNGFPSGGKYPANGVMTYIPATQGNGVATSYMETCTLPVTDHALCTVILNDFLRRYGGE